MPATEVRCNRLGPPEKEVAAHAPPRPQRQEQAAPRVLSEEKEVAAHARPSDPAGGTQLYE